MTTDRIEYFDKCVKTISNHFSKYGKMGKNPPVTRTLECAFETDSVFSDAIATTLIEKSKKSENLKAGLEFWNVWTTNKSWIESAKRHEGKSLKEIRETLISD